MTLFDQTVAIASMKEVLSYPSDSPFHPHEAYPELKGNVPIGHEKNGIYPLVRRLMYDLKMDRKHFTTSEWDPFSEIILPGQKVLIKPNLVRHMHLLGGDYWAMVTHGSLIRCLLDYVALALKGSGRIIVGDAPVQSADFLKIVERTGLREICQNVEKCWKIPVQLLDFRNHSIQMDSKRRVIKSCSQEGAPDGYVAVNLGKQSLLAEVENQNKKFRVTSYDSLEIGKHHNEKKHEYLIPRIVLDADVVINVPKLKTHRKVGLTAALKNIVGISGNKAWLPHHRCGSIAEGGDEYLHSSILKKYKTYLIEKIDQKPSTSFHYFYRQAIRVIDRINRFCARDPYEEGSWYGNDTIWRTVLDLNRLLLYTDRKGRIADRPQRKCFTIVDAVLAGEGEGPMEPTARWCGLLVGGMNPVAVDTILATIIGFDYRKIPLIAKGFEIKTYPLIDYNAEQIKVCSADKHWDKVTISNQNKAFNFIPPSGWKKHLANSERIPL